MAEMLPGHIEVDVPEDVGEGFMASTSSYHTQLARPLDASVMLQSPVSCLDQHGCLLLHEGTAGACVK